MPHSVILAFQCRQADWGLENLHVVQKNKFYV